MRHIIFSFIIKHPIPRFTSNSWHDVKSTTFTNSTFDANGDSLTGWCWCRALSYYSTNIYSWRAITQWWKSKTIYLWLWKCSSLMRLDTQIVTSSHFPFPNIIMADVLAFSFSSWWFTTTLSQPLPLSCHRRDVLVLPLSCHHRVMMVVLVWTLAFSQVAWKTIVRCGWSPIPFRGVSKSVRQNGTKLSALLYFLSRPKGRFGCGTRKENPPSYVRKSTTIWHAIQHNYFLLLSHMRPHLKMGIWWYDTTPWNILQHSGSSLLGPNNPHQHIQLKMVAWRWQQLLYHPLFRFVLQLEDVQHFLQQRYHDFCKIQTCRQNVHPPLSRFVDLWAHITIRKGGTLIPILTHLCSM